MNYNHQAAQTLWQQFQERYKSQLTPAILKAGEFALEAHAANPQIRRHALCFPCVSCCGDYAG